MQKIWLLKIANFSGWALLVMLVLYFTSGYAIVHKYGMDALMDGAQAWFWHKYLTIPFFIFLFLHIVPYYVLKKQVKRFLIILFTCIALPVVAVITVDKIQTPNESIQCPNCPKECIIEPGEKGECQQYENIDGKVQPVERE